MLVVVKVARFRHQRQGLAITVSAVAIFAVYRISRGLEIEPKELRAISPPARAPEQCRAGQVGEVKLGIGLVGRIWTVRSTMDLLRAHFPFWPKMHAHPSQLMAGGMPRGGTEHMVHSRYGALRYRGYQCTNPPARWNPAPREVREMCSTSTGNPCWMSRRRRAHCSSSSKFRWLSPEHFSISHEFVSGCLVIFSLCYIVMWH